MTTVSFTYGGNPTEIKLDAVRLLVADTIEATALLQDEDINYFLGQHGNPIMASALACEMLAMRFSGQVDKSIGKLNVSASQRAKAFSDRAKELRRRATATCVGILSGGQSWAAKRAALDNPDAIQPSFSIGMDDTYTDARPSEHVVWSRWR